MFSGRIAKSIALTEPIRWTAAEQAAPAVTGTEIAVTDPPKSVIHMIDAESFEKSRDIAVEGKPFNIVTIGGSGAVRD